MPTEMFVTENTSYAEVLDYAAKERIDNATLNKLLWGVLEVHGKKPKRTFSYGETLPATEAGCAPTFARSFVHLDWIDGESVVQAEETSIEAGFNNRFHKIEDDFDSVSADVVRLFECLAELRGDLAARLEEIRAELNRINTDIADCCNEDSDGPITWHPYDPGFYYPYPRPSYPGYYGSDVVNPSGPLINPAGPVINPYDRYTRFAFDRRNPTPDEVIKPWMPTDNTPFEIDGGNILRSTNNPDVAVISGMQGRRISTDTFNGKTVEVWSTPAGVIMTPADAAAVKGAKVGWTNPHIAGAATVTGWAMNNEERIKETLGGRGFTIKQLSDAFGEERLPGGSQLKTYLDQLPSGASARNGLEAARMVVERAGANVLRDRSGDETVIGLVGLNAQASPREIAVRALRSIPDRTAAQLEQAGIGTVGDLAKADPRKVAELGGVSPDMAAGWSAEAAVLSDLLGSGGRG